MNCENLSNSEILEKIAALPLGKVKIMEVCGTHTMSIAKSGLRSALPQNIELLSGPGCPVCVTPTETIDAILSLAERENVIIATYGDMLRVPGSERGKSLATSKAYGARVEVVYSPLDAVRIAEENPDFEVVFLGVGFETTAPGTAAAIMEAAEKKIRNFSVLSMLKTVEPALRALIADPEFSVSGFLCPGHVASIIGADAFSFLAEEFSLPCVVGGFEPREILIAVYKLLSQIAERKPHIENAYPQAVRDGGNPIAMKMTERVFKPKTSLWRGLSEIPQSGLSIREEFAHFDAEKKFEIEYVTKKEATPCRCGDVICGHISPRACPMFGKVCTPEDPVGPCMVSSEGACAAAYKYTEAI